MRNKSSIKYSWYKEKPESEKSDFKKDMENLFRKLECDPTNFKNALDFFIHLDEEIGRRGGVDYKKR